MQRRDFMEAVAALAATRWADEDYDPENVEEWDPIETSYATGEFTAESLFLSVDFPYSTILIEDDRKGIFDEREAHIWYDRHRVFISVDGVNDNGRAGIGLNCDPETAKELAAAIYQAA